MPSTFEGMSGVHPLASHVTETKGSVAGQLGICSRVGHPVFLTRCPPDFPRGIGVHRRDAESNDEIWPYRKCVCRHQSRRDDSNVRQAIISS